MTSTNLATGITHPLMVKSLKLLAPEIRESQKKDFEEKRLGLK